MFTVATPKNSQNDRLLRTCIVTQKKDAVKRLRIRHRRLVTRPVVVSELDLIILVLRVKVSWIHVVNL